MGINICPSGESLCDLWPTSVMEIFFQWFKCYWNGIKFNIHKFNLFPNDISHGFHFLRLLRVLQVSHSNEAAVSLFMLAFLSLGVFEWPYLPKLHRSVFFNRDFWAEPTRIMARRKWPKFFGPRKKKIGRPWFVDPKYGWWQPEIPSTVWMVLKPWKK